MVILKFTNPLSKAYSRRYALYKMSSGEFAEYGQSICFSMLSIHMSKLFSIRFNSSWYLCGWKKKQRDKHGTKIPHVEPCLAAKEKT